MKDPTTMFSTSHLFFFGDLNFRLSLPPTHAFAAPAQLSNLVQALTTDEGRSSLREYDQLVIERDVKGTIFQTFREGEFWRFKCSYKYKLGQVDHYEYGIFHSHQRTAKPHREFAAQSVCLPGQTG